MTVHSLKTRTAAESAFVDQFAATQGTAPALDREASFRAFTAKGLPTRRDETWHYTDLRSLVPEAAPLAAEPTAEAIAAAKKVLGARAAAGVRVAIVDGRFVPGLSEAPPTGVRIAALAQSDRAFSVGADVDALVALNGGLAQGGCIVTVEAGVKAAAPIEIVHLMTAGAAKSVYSRVSVVIGAGAEVRLVESYIGAGPGCQRNAATLLELAERAKATHCAVLEDDAAVHIESQLVRLSDKAEFSAFGFVAGAALVRRQIFATLVGQHTNLALAGLSLLNGKRHADTTLVVEHAAPHGQSREFYKHIVADDATGVYQGKVIVQPGAQKTDGGMKSQAILLSPHAAMNNKPELEIFADDVVCGHGATVGALDPEQLFYLRARGLAKAEAEAMLLEAFGADVIARVEDEALGELLREKMRVWLAARG